MDSRSVTVYLPLLVEQEPIVKVRAQLWLSEHLLSLSGHVGNLLEQRAKGGTRVNIHHHSKRDTLMLPRVA